jgi:hypothetical protein
LLDFHNFHFVLRTIIYFLGLGALISDSVPLLLSVNGGLVAATAASLIDVGRGFLP